MQALLPAWALSLQFRSNHVDAVLMPRRARSLRLAALRTGELRGNEQGDPACEWMPRGLTCSQEGYYLRVKPHGKIISVRQLTTQQAPCSGAHHSAHSRVKHALQSITAAEMCDISSLTLRLHA